MIFRNILKHARRLPPDYFWRYIWFQICMDVRYYLGELRALVDWRYRARREAMKRMWRTAIEWPRQLDNEEHF